ncbi:poly-gamma-glutamate biosynthesis protein PgsC [Peribacillus huizhouensis]|uniref:Poly-gamma-glutamate biosynthesis protein PgsC/CapC n=1 Tax=Peribacillus huizhouensis TaxID=1501239 RepID=A0ABR6CMS7_9BACI|nr:poly-gamma-glutamate biosynthesis protein PgsC [Peribacillus huizhouensis]MBA9026339.1 poly-gamma-glutamate biosynthesis protein PgsC/CapC [Peribacillus huizhouensis]
MEVYIALVVGVILSLFYAEKTGIIPAGLVVPGYLALVFTSPLFLLVTILISLLTFLIVTKVVTRFTILYGRRKFTAMLTVGILLKLTFDYFYSLAVPIEVVGLAAIGVIVPGLIANTIQKQGVFPTLSSTLLLTASTFCIVLTYKILF